MSGNVFGRIVRLVARRPVPVLALTLVLALGGGALALRLEPSAATDTLVGRSSDSFRDTERYRRDFGDEAVVVLVKGDLTKTVLTPDLLRVLGLEGCLGRQHPGGRAARRRWPRTARTRRAGCRPRAGSSRELHPAKAVYGPAHVHQHLRRPDQRRVPAALERGRARRPRKAARAARKLSAARGDSEAEQQRLARPPARR